MGSLFVGKILVAIAEKPASKPVEAELEPIQPGAWAAWAKADADEQAAVAEPIVKGEAPGLVPAALSR